MNPDTTAHAAGPSWRQVLVHFPDYATAEHTGVAHLGPELTSADTTGAIASWFFVRKNPCWRLRFLPAHRSEQDPTTVLHRRLDTLRHAGHIARWVETIYEPETHAFGGPAGMTLAHRLFHADSRHILTHLATMPGDRGERRRELSVLLCSTLMRAAGQDWSEQGDIWARVAETRPGPPDPPPDRPSTLESGLRRLLTVDTSPTSLPLSEHGPPKVFSEWAAAFAETGRALGDLARTGTLRRGLRAVLAHHILFHWNRLGLPYTTQSLLAHTATTVVLGGKETG